MSFTIVPYDTYSTNQDSSVISALGALGLKLIVTSDPGGFNDSALLVRIWSCDSEGTFGELLGNRDIYPATSTTVIGAQPGVTATVAEPETGYYVVTINTSLPPFIRIRVSRDDVVDHTYGIEGLLF